MRIKCLLLLLVMMFFVVGGAMADNWDDPGDPGLFLTGTAALGGVTNNGTTSITSLASWSNGTLEPSITFGSGANVTYFTNNTLAAFKSLFIIAPVLTAAPESGGISQYGCGVTLGVPPTYFSSCTSFFDNTDFGGQYVVFEYFGGSIPVGDTFGVLGDSLWAADNGKIELAQAPEPASIALFGQRSAGSVRHFAAQTPQVIRLLQWRAMRTAWLTS